MKIYKKRCRKRHAKHDAEIIENGCQIAPKRDLKSRKIENKGITKIDAKIDATKRSIHKPEAA